MAGDYWDWFVLKAEKGGTLTVATRAEEGDLILEAFSPGEFAEALERSDQDLQGNGGNEALTLVVDPGDEFFFKVSAFSQGPSIPVPASGGVYSELSEPMCPPPIFRSALHDRATSHGEPPFRRAGSRPWSSLPLLLVPPATPAEPRESPSRRVGPTPQTKTLSSGSQGWW